VPRIGSDRFHIPVATGLIAPPAKWGVAVFRQQSEHPTELPLRQGKMCCRPQNIRWWVAAMPTCSGAHAKGHKSNPMCCIRS